MVYESILMMFSPFSQWMALSEGLESSHIHGQMAPQFPGNWGQKL